MSKFAPLAAVLLLAVPAALAAPPAAKPGTIVIVFKDGHRQIYNLSDVLRVEFPAADTPAAVSTQLPPRGHYLGKWEVGDGNGQNFYITLYDDGTARRSIGNARGKWVYIDGEARVSWEDGAQDAIRKVGGKYQKFYYAAGKSFTDNPDNVTDAHNTTPKPI